MLKKILTKIFKISNKLRNVGIVRFKFVINKPENQSKFIIKIGGLIFNYYEPILYVGKGEKFTQIQEAVDNSYDTPKHKVVIKVSPGVYSKVKVGGQRHISIIGSDKKDCIIRDDSGIYANAPLEIEGDCLVKNLTIVSTHKENRNPVDGLRAYAVHSDWYGEGISEFNNCTLVSYQNAAFGCGLHTNQTVILKNCELYSYCPKESSMTQNGALFVHDGNGATNQNLIVKDCIVKSLYGYSHYLNGHYGTEMTASYYNNIFWCEESGQNSIHLDSAINGISNNIKLSKDSFGNNIEILNN